MSTLSGLIEQLRAEETRIREGGGAKAIERQHAKHRLTARERIARLIDAPDAFFELGLWAAWQMYADWGGAPPPASSRASASSRAGRRWSSPTTRPSRPVPSSR